jgi:hypothetical protein
VLVLKQEQKEDRKHVVSLKQTHTLLALVEADLREEKKDSSRCLVAVPDT